MFKEITLKTFSFCLVFISYLWEEGTLMPLSKKHFAVTIFSQQQDKDLNLG